MSKAKGTNPAAGYTVGGTVQAGGGVYIPREADLQLLELCRAGAFTYMLTPRQMGKSSLMVRTSRQLNSEGVRTVTIDLSAFGVTVTAEQWYFSLILTIEEQLGLETDALTWWKERQQVGPVQRLRDFLREVVLKEVEEQVVIFIDEIDTTLGLGFTDDFYAVIRSLYHMRTESPALRRLSFVLIGVATPGDLISDPKRTPFNIGQRVDLTDFTPEEALPLAVGLGLPPEEAGRVHGWIMGWTGGHPYLTQRLYRAVAERGALDWTGEGIDALVAETFFGEKSERDANLTTVRDMLTRRADDPEAVLNTYLHILKGKRPVPDEEQSLVKSHLKLSGAVRRQDGLLVVRNRIYREVFDERWVKAHLPVNWPKRLARVGAGALAAVVLVAAFLAPYAWSQKEAAEKALAEARVQSQRAEANAVEAMRQKELAERAAEEARLQAQRAEEQTEVAKQQRELAETNARKASEQQQLAEASAREALRQRQVAEESLVNEAAARREVEEARRDAVSKGNVAYNRQLLAQASRLSQQPSELPRSSLLAKAAIDRARTDHLPPLQAYDLLNSTLRLLPRPAERLNFEGSPADSVAYSPDGKYLLAAKMLGVDPSLDSFEDPKETAPKSAANASQGSIIVRERDGGRKVFELTLAVKESLHTLAISPDRKYVAASVSIAGESMLDFTQQVRVWRWADDGSLQLARSFDQVTIPDALAVSPGGRYLVTGRNINSFIDEDQEHSLEAYEIASGRVAEVRSSGRVLALAYSPDGRLLAEARGAGEERSAGDVSVWAGDDTLAVINTSPAISIPNDRRVTAATFSPDGNYIAAGADDGTVRIWLLPDVTAEPETTAAASAGPAPTPSPSPTPSATFVAVVKHDAAVSDIAFSPDGAHLGTAGGDKTARVWARWQSARAYEVARVSHEKTATVVAFDPRGGYFTTAGKDESVRTWVTPNGVDDIALYMGDEEGMVALSHNKRYWAFYDDFSRTTDSALPGTTPIILWDASNGSFRTLSVNRIGPERLIGVSEDGKLVAVGYRRPAAETSGNSDEVRVLDVASGKVVYSARAVAPHRRAFFSPDNKYLVTTPLSSAALELFDLGRSGAPGRVLLQGSEASVADDYAFSPDGKYVVATQRQDGPRIKVWRLESGEELKDWGPPLTTGRISREWGMAFSDDGRTLAVIDGKALRVIKFPEGRLVSSMENTEDVSWLDFSDDGRYVAYSAGGMARVFDVRTGATVSTVRSKDNIGLVDLSPSGKYLVTSGGVVSVWNVSTGCEVTSFGGDVSFAFFTPDEDYLVAIGNRVERRLWAPERLEAEVCRRVIRNISYDEWHNQYLIAEGLPKTCAGLAQDATPTEELNSCNLPPPAAAPAPAPKASR